MLNVFAKTIMTATRTAQSPDHRSRAHWPQAERFDTRERARLEAHRISRLRD